LNLVELLQGTNVALRVLQAKLVVIICMAMTMVLFSWAMWLQSTLGAIIAATWGLTIFLPVLYSGTGRRAHGVSEAQEQPAGEPPAR
jgi:hypothetical protein